MASKSRKKTRRSRKQANNSLAWLIVGAFGVVVLVVAALMLRANDDSNAGGPGQHEFDPDFEPQVNGAPRVEVVQDDVIDYGNVELGKTINTVYTVRNVGDEPLVVLGEPQVELVEGC